MLCRYTFMVVNQTDVTWHILTIDAMGCQRGIAEKIRNKGADYILALKGNQGTLNDDVRLFCRQRQQKRYLWQSVTPAARAMPGALSCAMAGIKTGMERAGEHRHYS